MRWGRSIRAHQQPDVNFSDEVAWFWRNIPSPLNCIIERLQALRASAAGNNFGSRCPSVSLGVSFDDQTTYEWNFGRRDLKQNLALNVDTVHGIGSLSKKFTASAIGILVDEGRLSWQTSVREILREYHSRSQFTTQELTVEDLLSHRSGMAHSHYWWYGAGGELLIDKTTATGNFTALGEIVERLTSMPHGSFINERIIVPLNMSRTTESHANVDDDNLAVPHAILNDLPAYELPLPKSLARRAIFTSIKENFSQLQFSSNEAGNIDKLFWAHDGSVPAKEQFFVKVTLDQ
ncbi:hypothetical protein NHJ13734_007194 [Beauveria thailandica]